MFQATTSSTAPSTASGTCTASGASSRTKAVSVSACAMPAIGVRPPDRKFVAVRAIAPVTGIPPTIGTRTFATPCASSSAFELCRSPIRLSATTADSRLSTAASSATVTADGRSGRIRSALNSGMLIEGNPEGRPPNRDPIVSTGRPKTATASVASTTATIDPGIRGQRRGTTRITARPASAMATAAALKVGSAAPSAAIREKNSLGTGDTRRPSRSLICVDAMSRAMPLVKPSTTGRGMNLTALPRPVMASTSSITPAIIVTISRPETPCLAMMPATMTTKAPVGPPI